MASSDVVVLVMMTAFLFFILGYFMGRAHGKLEILLSQDEARREASDANSK